MRKKTKIVTSKAINEYIDEHKADLAKRGIDPLDLKTRSEEVMANYYRGKKAFEKAVKREMSKLDMSRAEQDLFSAKQDSIFEGDKRQFNKKTYEAYVDTNIEIVLDDGTPATVIGYWAITGSPYVLATIITENPFDSTGKSPMEMNQYIPRGAVGLR